MVRCAIALAAFVGYGVVASAQTLPDGPGKELVETICSACHSTLIITQQKKSKPEWQAKVTQMLQEEADVTAAERDRIVNYLAASFPESAPVKVNINKAAANELEAVLGLSPRDAQAIVRYRDEKGEFKNLEALKKVPGLDAAKIEAAKDRLEF